MEATNLKREANTASAAITVIRPSGRWAPLNLRDLWHYRELFYFLTWREIKVRYKQTLLGIVWSVLRPLFMMVVFTLFFGKLAQIPSEGVPYPLFSYAALLPWTLLAEGVTRSANSLVQDSNLIRKVYFPRLLMPLSGVLSSLVDFAIAFTILGGMMFYYGYPPTMQMVWVPAFIILTLLTAVGVGLWLSAINVKYRDVRHAIPFLVQGWLFASPVIYSSSLLPQQFQTIYGLNPMAGVIEGFRWSLLGIEPSGSLIGISVIVIVGILISGVFYFRCQEKIFADVV